MGFLDHSTNNIILDAVLTDTGRQFLARNDGSFSIFKFALGDDEVNYNIIKKYGRTVGKEKIEKNTPVFEALTNQQHALKYKLISASNPNLIKLPSLDLKIGGTNGNVYLNSTTLKTVTLTIEQVLTAETTFETDLVDQIFLIQVPHLFLYITEDTPDNIDGQQIATYTTPRNSTLLSTGGSQLTITLGIKSITDTLYAVYGNNTSTIKTYIRIVGMQSGASETIPVTIQKT